MRRTLLALVLAFTYILAGCAGEQGAAAGGGGGTPISESTRVDASNAAIAAFVSMSGKTEAERSVALPAVWKTISGFADAGYDPDSQTYWAIFTDGVPFMYMNGHTQGSTPPRPSPKAANDLPVPKNLALFDSLGTSFTHYESAIKSLTEKRGYSATTSRGFIEELAAVNGVGGLHWNTHGGNGFRAEFFPAKKIHVYGLWTDTLMSKTPPANIAAMIANSELGVAGAAVDTIGAPVDLNGNGTIDPDERVTHEGHYMILPKFVHNHMKLGKNSFVWVDACSSSTDAGLISEFLGKGADVYLGWDNITSGTGPAVIAFDRMLGENGVNPSDSPPYRPENIFDVVGWLQRQGLDKINTGGKIATLKYFTANPDNFALLRPTIQHCFVEESLIQSVPARLMITGQFGAERTYPHSVTVDDVPLAVKSWEPLQIVCDLPNQGAGTYGPVVVHVNGHDSNEVPITLYQVRFKYRYVDQGTLFYQWDMVANIRQDVHLARSKPWELPHGTDKQFGIMWTSTAAFTSGGSYTIPNVGVETWSGGGPVPMSFTLTPPAKYFNFLGLDWSTETGIISQAAPSGSYPVLIKITGQTDDKLDAVPAVHPSDFTVDKNYAFKGGTQKLVTATGVGTLTWSDTGGVFAPDSTTQARPKR